MTGYPEIIVYCMIPVISGFQHSAGRHCGSTSLRDISNFGGWPLSEAAVFGLASGLASYFIESPGIFMGRCRNLEVNYLKAFRLPYVIRQYKTFRELHDFIDSKMKNGQPVMLQGDVHGLSYYNSPVHFPGHKFVICGKDADTFYAADTNFAEYQAVSLKALEKTTAYEDNIWPGIFTAFDIELPLPALDAARGLQSLKTSFSVQLKELAQPDDPVFKGGHTGLQLWAQSLNVDIWKDANFKIISRFVYQVIEKRGTGGGAFRGLYKDFLTEIIEDTIFPFSIHSSIEAGSDKLLNLLVELRALTEAEFGLLRQIAMKYKMLSIEKIALNPAKQEIQTLLNTFEKTEFQMIQCLNSIVDIF